MGENAPDWLVYGVGGLLENFWYPIVFWAGALVGSFLGVVIWRLPLIVLSEPRPKNFSLTEPPSHCPRCDYLIPWWQNVPIFGFLFLRGRCFHCKTPIPWRDFAMEILTASVWVALFHRYNQGHPISWINFVFLALFASLLIAAVFIDLDHFIVPDEMNWWGIAFGVVRDLLCIGAAFVLVGPALRPEALGEFTYFGWLPRSIPGALLYGGVLWLVAFLGFVYYARVPWESQGSVARRFFTYADAPEAPDEWKERIAEEEAREKAEAEARATAGEAEEEDVPVRLRFSPGFITILSAGFLSFVIGWWSLLAVVLPLLAFVAVTRTGQETAGDAVRRFFRADDLPYSDIEAPEASEALSVADAQAEADQFAREAETGTHGGMGLGDAKLALAIGAVLGPFPAMLSLFVATFIGAVTGLVLKRVYNKPNLRYGLPFVPFMAAGALVVMLFGQQLVDWYRTLLPGAAPAAVAPQTAPGEPRRRRAPMRPAAPPVGGDPTAPYR